eukprot:TRINITY_DN8476_c0_g1_i1.p1 TRINITY_DN8476_c0_g1~~TRINITY_DN8476_c0_g1_i1.p1  ORF type:complete len:927 (+),score=232.91 TRINITY_DN8476_c0_g1_i1:281-3061(+)
MGRSANIERVMALEIKKKYSYDSERAKAVDIHPLEPWVISALFSGHVEIHDYSKKTMVRRFEVSKYPVRCVKFIPRKQWIICGADDFQLRVYNYNTSELVHKWEGHIDYIRDISIHPTLPYILSSSDDGLIKMWDWDNGFRCVKEFEGHGHYVMKVDFNPKDPNQFASASLDKTVKMWGLTSNRPHYSLDKKLKGHTKGINSVSFYYGADKPYLISGADDKVAKIWDYQTKSVIHTLTGHTKNITYVAFHPSLPLIITAAEDGEIRIYNAITFKHEQTLVPNMGRVWCGAVSVGSTGAVFGFDRGILYIKLGKENPAASMDHTGKILFSKQNDVFTANARNVGEVEDGETLNIQVKDFTTVEVFPKRIEHSPNGRLCVICSDNEYTIFMAIAGRNKTFGTAEKFGWGLGKGLYVTKQGPIIHIYQNFEEKDRLKLNYPVNNIFGGTLIAVASTNFICFYDWETASVVRKVDIKSKNVYWSDSGKQFIISTEESFYVLKYNRSVVEKYLENNGSFPDTGIEGSIELVQGEIPDKIRTGKWSDDCFFYTTSDNRIRYWVNGNTETIANLEKSAYLLGYVPRNNRIFLIDKSSSIISYRLDVSVTRFQSHVIDGNIELAMDMLNDIPEINHPKLALFLENKGYLREAMGLSPDIDQKFDIAIRLKDMDLAIELAEEDESPNKWRQISEVALKLWKFDIAETALWKGSDISGLYLLYTSTANAEGLEKLAQESIKLARYNIAFDCLFVLGQVNAALDILIKSERYTEAAYFAQSYVPSRVNELISIWKSSIARGNVKAAELIADPERFPNLFPDQELLLEVESKMRPIDPTPLELLDSTEYPTLNVDRRKQDLINQYNQIENTENIEEPNEPVMETTDIAEEAVDSAIDPKEQEQVGIEDIEDNEEEKEGNEDDEVLEEDNEVLEESGDI